MGDSKIIMWRQIDPQYYLMQIKENIRILILWLDFVIVINVLKYYHNYIFDSTAIEYT